MGRIRSIKPEFPHSESMGAVSRDARLLFIMLFTLADDSGRLRGNSRMLASLLFPYDSDAPSLIDSWVDELVKQSTIDVYSVGASTYIQIRKWLIHQKIDKPSASKIPEFYESSRVLHESSTTDRIKDQGVDQGVEGIKEVKEHKCSLPVKKTETRQGAPKILCPQNVSETTWQEFVAHRKRKSATISELVIKSIEAEATKAGWTLENALKEVVVRNWQSFKSEWVADKQNQSFAQIKADIASQTVPSKPGKCPALQKLDEDNARVVPMPENVKEALKLIRSNI